VKDNMSATSSEFILVGDIEIDCFRNIRMPQKEKKKSGI
jgi:hypothetical protein